MKLPFIKSVVGYLVQSVQYFNIRQGLALRSVQDDSITFANIGGKRLYALRITVRDNVPQPIDIERLREGFQHENDASFGYYYVKNREYQAVFVLSFNEHIISEIAHDFDTVKMSGKEIAGMLFDFVLGNDVVTDPIEYTQHQILDFEEESEETLLDPLYYSYNEMLRQEIYELQDDYEFYQVIKAKQRKKFADFGVFNRYDANFVFGLFVDVAKNSIERHIKNHHNYARLFDQEAREGITRFMEAQEGYDLPMALINGYVITNDPKAANAFAEAFGLSVESHRLFVQSIVEKTIVAQRDISYNLLVQTERVKQMACGFIRKRIDKQELAELESPIDLHGVDIFGAATNFRFRSNNSPHALIVGPTGSGKSVFTQEIYAQTERLEPSTGRCAYFDRFYWRYFDVGRSAFPVMSNVKNTYGEAVGVFEPNIEDIRVALFDLRRGKNGMWDKEDVLQALSLADMTLLSNNSEGLTLQERRQIQNMLDAVAKRDMPHDFTIRKCADMGYDEAKKLIASGVDPFDEICRHGIETFDIPLLGDVIALLRKQSNSPTAPEDIKLICASAATKLAAIESLEVFSYFNKVRFDMRRVFYSEFGNIKNEQTLFVPLFWAMIRRMSRIDIDDAIALRSAGKVLPNRYYGIEESHNFLSVPSFAELFDKSVREWRKYRIHLFFITQNLEDIPAKMIKNIATKILLVPKDRNDQEAMLKSLTNHADVADPDSVRYIFSRMRPRQALIVSHQGMFGLDLKVSKEKLELYAT